MKGPLSHDGSDSEDFLNDLNKANNLSAEEVPITALLGIRSKRNSNQNSELNISREAIKPEEIEGRLLETKILRTSDMLLPESTKKNVDFGRSFLSPDRQFETSYSQNRSRLVMQPEIVTSKVSS